MSFNETYTNAFAIANEAALEMEQLQQQVKDQMKDARRRMNRAFRDAKRVSIDAWIEKVQLSIADGVIAFDSREDAPEYEGCQTHYQILFINRIKKDATVTMRPEGRPNDIITVPIAEFIDGTYATETIPNPQVFNRKEFIAQAKAYAANAVAEFNSDDSA